MPSYVPILKSKPAEIWAWQNASPTALSASRVVFEVVPTETKTPAVINFVRTPATCLRFNSGNRSVPSFDAEGRK